MAWPACSHGRTNGEGPPALTSSTGLGSRDDRTFVAMSAYCNIRRRLAGSQTPVFHRYYETKDLEPNFFTDDEATRRALEGGPPAFR